MDSRPRYRKCAHSLPRLPPSQIISTRRCLGQQSCAASKDARVWLFEWPREFIIQQVRGRCLFCSRSSPRLWEAEQEPGNLGSLSIRQICDRGQKHCDHEMNANHWDGRDHGHGWESNKSLLRYDLIQRDQHGRGYATGWRGPVDSVRLTAEGRAFIPEMLKKFSRASERDAEAEIISFACARALPDQVQRHTNQTAS